MFDVVSFPLEFNYFLFNFLKKKTIFYLIVRI